MVHNTALLESCEGVRAQIGQQASSIADRAMAQYRASRPTIRSATNNKSAKSLISFSQLPAAVFTAYVVIRDHAVSGQDVSPIKEHLERLLRADSCLTSGEQWTPVFRRRC